MKIKNKGKVYPSPSSSPSSSSSVASSSANGDGYLSVLKLLPATMLVLASVLSVEDREVLAYLITRSLKTTTTATTTTSSSGGGGGGGGKSRSQVVYGGASSAGVYDSKNKKKKSGKKGETHKPPVFDCDCFDCYTSYWLRWDSSPNRELIHQVIEAFEDHLSSGEATGSQKPKRNNGRGKKNKEKSGRPVADNMPKPVEPSGRPDESVAETSSEVREPPEVGAVSGDVPSPPEGHLSAANSPGRLGANEEGPEVAEREEEVESAGDAPESSEMVVPPPAESGHKGLARKVLPDVLGLLNSRLWSLWNPNA